ncbi:hypothetical protein BGZ73_001636, partial [Actinomortierella ambigua]
IIVHRGRGHFLGVEAFHGVITRALYNHGTKFNSVTNVTEFLLKRFEGLDTDFFIDGDGNAEKYYTSGLRRDRTEALDDAESRVDEMEQLATQGRGIKKSSFQAAQKTLRSSIFPTIQFKRAIVQALQQAQKTVLRCSGEADLAIRARSLQPQSQELAYVVVGNDCDYAIHPGTSRLLRPWRGRYVDYNIDALLTKAGLMRVQYQALGVVSKTGYSWNLPGLGLGRNRAIIKACTS